MADIRKLLYTDVIPYYADGQAVGVRASLAGALRFHLQRLIQTGQADFLATTESSLVVEASLGVDGRGSEKAKIGK